LVSDVYEEYGRWYTVHGRYTTEYAVHFLPLTAQYEFLFLGYTLESTISEHFLDALHLLYALADSREVGKHATQPPLSDIRHVYALCSFFHYFFRLLFSSYEEYFLSRLSHRLHSL